MKSNATPSKSVANSSSRRHSYTKVLDNRKHPIRGLWKRNGNFLGRITIEDDAGRKAVKWVALAGATAAEAQEELRRLLVERGENRLRHTGRSPKLGEYIEQAYLPRLAASGKKLDTLVTEKGHLNRWRDALGHLYLDKIRPYHITAHVQSLKVRGRANRTCNLALVCLRNVLKMARMDGYIKALPAEGIPWMRTEGKARTLYTRADIDVFCRASLRSSRNGPQFADYLRLLALTGAREQEAIKLCWADVDFERKLLTIGADADTKNRECRRVDFNSELETHLRDMHARRAPDSVWMFPSPQRGERDERAKTFRESLLLTRQVSGCVCEDCQRTTFAADVPPVCGYCQSPRVEFKQCALPAHLQRFGFHDCRHHFISYAVMSGIDFMTIAKWVGHKDGGVLIGKVYGHLADDHRKAQAARLSFGPAIVAPSVVAAIVKAPNAG